MQTFGPAGPTRPPDWDRSLPASFDQISQTLEQLSRTLSKRSDAPAPETMWELVMAEAMNNIAEHAYADVLDNGADDGAARWIRASIWLDGAAMVIRLMDGGAPMPGLALPDGTAPSLNTATDDLPEGGFGWAMIRQITTSVRYTRQNDVNCVLLTVATTTPDP